MRVALGTFARSGIEARFGTDAKAGIEAALRHYTRRLKSRKPPVAVPDFSRMKAPASVDETFELDVGPEIAETLTREASGQAISTDLLVNHAVLVYLADLDANIGDSPALPTEEAAALPRYQRRCVSFDPGFWLATRRHVGSA